MTPIHINLKRGTTMATVTITVTDADSNPYDLTGATVESAARGVSKDVTDVIPLVAEITDPASGVVVVSLPAADSLTSTPGRYAWDVIISLSDGKVLPPIQTGTLVITKTVTLD